jgi:manganese/zinc/iron transport system substrate-binding protein
MNWGLFSAAACSALLVCAGCSPGAPANLSPAADRKIKVVATTSMVADLVKNVGGDRIELHSLMGPGVDPHLYKATASDVLKLQQADLIFYNGLLLEGKMQDLFGQMARQKKFVYAVTEDLPKDQLLEPPALGGHYDPHVWFDVPLWSQCALKVAQGLGEFDTNNKALYDQRASELQKSLADLHAWALKKAAELPKERRIVVTSHDAFNYLGRAYDFQVVGLQGISTVTEAGVADMARMVDFLKEKKVPAVFVESSVSHATIERISTDAGVKIGGELFSDAMGAPGEIENGYDLGTYHGMIKHNLNTIVAALK